MTAEGIMDVHPGRPVYITIASFCKLEVQLPKHQKVGEVLDARVEIVHNSEEYFSYPCDAQMNNSGS